MDYQYYQPAPQPFSYGMGLPPTPSHTHPGSANSDDFNDSPPEASSFSDFQPYDAYYQHVNQNVVKPPTPQLISEPKLPLSASVSGYDLNADANEANQRSSNSDDDDNHKGSRRKEQNRAAQRAFRERKERHVKDLEAKNAELVKNAATVAQENERLRQQLQKTATENEILKATSAHPSRGGSEPLPNAGPMRYSPTDFYTDVLYAHDNKNPSHRITTSTSGERLLAAGATWDYIIKHDLYIRGLVDVGDISERLKKVAKCDGQGPVFAENEILLAIKQSVASGSDELL